MLRMGFIDDVEWVLEQTPDDIQIALFSATMPTAIRKIAQEYLHEPEQNHHQSHHRISRIYTPTLLDGQRCTQTGRAHPHP